MGGEMEDDDMWKLLVTKTNDDVLLEIFKHLDIFESRNSGLLRFCEAWRRVTCGDPLLSETLDFSMLKSHYIKTSERPFIYVETRFDNTLATLLLIAFKSTPGKNIRTLIFHYNLFLDNHHFVLSAKRCPGLRRLVFVSWNRIKKIVMRKAIRGWKDLESMTMPSIKDPRYVFEEISVHCQNFRELKIMGHFHLRFALSLARFLPNLKVLSLRCSRVDNDALNFILDRLVHLQVLNISHCYIPKDVDPCILEKASRLRKFHICLQQSCIMCQRTRKDEGLPRWYRYEEGIWKADEISSLAL